MLDLLSYRQVNILIENMKEEYKNALLFGS